MQNLRAARLREDSWFPWRHGQKANWLQTRAKKTKKRYHRLLHQVRNGNRTEWSPIRSVTIRVIREFKKLRRQLQRKRHIKIELCVKLIFLRLSRVDHVVQNRRTALSLAWHEWFS